MAKVKYLGMKPKMHIALPLKAKSKGAIVDVVVFKPGEVKEIPDADALLLAASESGFAIVEDKKPSSSKSKKSEGFSMTAEVLEAN